MVENDVRSNEISIFESPEFGNIRTVLIEDKPYFVASDVAKCLGYKRPNDAITQHCRGTAKHRIGVETGLKADGTPAIQNVDMLVIPEGDIYRLIARSKLPTAEKFESWVFDEVLPSIRKHGAYMTPQKIEEILLNPDTIIQLATTLKDEQEKNKRLQLEIAHKQEVITGLTDDIDVYKKKDIINRICRYNYNNYANRYKELYKCFRENEHVDLEARCEGYNLKQTKKKNRLTTIKYAEKFGFIDSLYTYCVKLYEIEVKEIIQQLNKIQN